MRREPSNTLKMMNDQFRVRAGYYHHATPISQNVYTASLPDANSHGITMGFGYDLTKNFTIDLGYSGLFYEPRKVNTDITSTDIGSSTDGRYTQVTHIGMATFTYRF